MLTVESTVQAKKVQTVKTPSPVHTADVMEDSCVIEVSDDDQPWLNSELQTGTSAGRKIKNKSRLSEMDSGIVVGEVEDDAAIGQAAWKKASPPGAKVKQESSATRVKRSQPESSASSKYGQTCHVNSVTVSSQSTDEMLPEESSDCSSSRVPSMSESLTAVGHGKLNLTDEFDATEVTHLTDAMSPVEVLRKKTKRQLADQKCARKDVDKQRQAPRCIDNSSEIENAGVVDGDDIDDDDQIVINSSDDETASASHQMALSGSRGDAGIVIILIVYEFLANVNSSSCSLYVIVRPSVVCLSVVCL